MTYEDHISTAKTLLLAEDMLSRSGFGIVAAEVIWGAAVQVIDAISHQAGSRHISNNHGREQIVEDMQDKYALDDLGRGLRSVSRLHNHFYTGRLSDQELPGLLETGLQFVNQMIELAEMEGSPN